MDVIVCLTILCFPPRKPEVAADSFCSAYERVIRDPGDGNSVARTRASVQKRVARNDVLYKCTCQNWNNPICKGLK